MLKKFLLILFIIFLCLMPVLFKKERETQKTVVFWTLQMSAQADYLKNIISEFEKNNPSVKIKWVDVPYSEGEKRTLASVLSDNPPDLVNLTPDFSATLAQKGALMSIPKNKLSDFNDDLLESLKNKEEYYALPFYVTSAITVYNKSLISALKQEIKTFDELNSLTLNAKLPVGVYMNFPVICENDTFLKILNKYDINTFEKIKSEESQKIFNEYKVLYQKDLLPKETITQTHREALEKYMSGQVVYLQTGSNFLSNIRDNAPQIYKNTEVSNQLTGSTGKYDYSLMNLVIPKKSKSQKEALAFALYLLNEENQLKLAKLIPVLPTNKKTLKNDYFKNFENNDLTSKARVLAAQQLNNLQKPVMIDKNKKDILNQLNSTTQEILLGKKDTKKALFDFSNKWKSYN